MEYERDKYVSPGKRIHRNGTITGHGQGLAVRDYFAIRFAAKMITTANWNLNGRDDLAEDAYAFADAMLAAREASQ